MQLNFFSELDAATPHAPKPRKPREASLRGQLGAERAAGKAERKRPVWVDHAVGELRAFALRQPEGAEFTIEKARRECSPMPPSADARAWGAVTQAAIRSGFLERVPGRFEPAESSNGSPKPVYTRGKAA